LTSVSVISSSAARNASIASRLPAIKLRRPPQAWRITSAPLQPT
jgi:hypothetical protein